MKTCTVDGGEICGDIFTYPLRYVNNVFELANSTFCSLACVKFYLHSNVLNCYDRLALFALYCEQQYGVYNVQSSPDPRFLTSRQIQTDDTGLSLIEFRQPMTKCIVSSTQTTSQVVSDDLHLHIIDRSVKTLSPDYWVEDGDMSKHTKSDQS